MKSILIKMLALITLAILPQLPAKATTLVVLGDSLSAGYGMAQAESWVGILQQRWSVSYPDITLINASISGDTTQGALHRLPGVIRVISLLQCLSSLAVMMVCVVSHRLQ